MNASLSTVFVVSYPHSPFTEPNMMVVLLSGASSLRDSKCSNLLAQWMSLSPLVRARFSEAMDHPPPSRQSTKPRCRPSIRMRSPLSRTLSNRALCGVGCTLVRLLCAVRVHYPPRPCLQRSHWVALPRSIPTRDKFDATWKSSTAPLVLSPPLECADPRHKVAFGPYGRGRNMCNSS